MSRETDRRPAAPRGAGRPPARWRRKRRLLRASCLAVSALLVAGLLSSCSSDGRTTLVFFQFKGEARAKVEMFRGRHHQTSGNNASSVRNQMDGEWN